MALFPTLEASDVGPRMNGKSGVGTVGFALDKRRFVIIKLFATEVALLRKTGSEDNNGEEIWELNPDVLHEVHLSLDIANP